MIAPVYNCQITGSKDANNVKSTFNRFRILAKPLIVSILTAFLLAAGLVDAMGNPHVSPYKDSGEINGLITPISGPVQGPTTVMLLGIALAGLAGADARRRWGKNS